MVMKAIAFIVSWLTGESAVTEVSTVYRDHGSRQKAAIYLQTLEERLYSSSLSESQAP